MEKKNYHRAAPGIEPGILGYLPNVYHNTWLQERSSAWHVLSSDRRGDRGLEPRRAFAQGPFLPVTPRFVHHPENHFPDVGKMVYV